MAKFQGRLWLAKPTIEFVGSTISMGRQQSVKPVDLRLPKQPTYFAIRFLGRPLAGTTPNRRSHASPVSYAASNTFGRSRPP